MRDRPPRRNHTGTRGSVIDADTNDAGSCVIIQRQGLRVSLTEDMELPYAVKDALSSLPESICASNASLPQDGTPREPRGVEPGNLPGDIRKAHTSPMKTVLLPAGRTGPHGRCPHRLQSGSLRSAAISLLALGVAFGACAQTPKTEPAPDPDNDFLEGVLIDAPSETPPAAPVANGEQAPAATQPEQGTDTTAGAGELDIDTDSDPVTSSDPAGQSPQEETPADQTPAGPTSPTDEADTTAGAADDASPLSAWLEPLRISLKHEVSYKFASPKRVVNNRSSVRLEYSKALTSNLYFRLDTKYNLHWGNDHRAQAKDENPFHELVTREAYLQSSFGNTSFRRSSSSIRS